MNRTRFPLFLVLAAVMTATTFADDPPAPPLPRSEVAATVDPTPGWIGSLRWRSIGPATMGGRIVDLAVLADHPLTWYVATASGGIFKTTNGGTTFAPIFDQAKSLSIGDMAIAPSDPNVLWVGTGEHNGRNSVSWGDGVYRSTDAGKTWKHVGLGKSFQVGRITVDPRDPEIAWVGVLGRLWGPSPERGLYRTIDGGKSWKRVLAVDEKTGCIDVALCPGKPDTVLAAMYERQRDEFDVGDPKKRWGPGSGLYRSTDAGKTWTRLTRGLPTVKLGRIGITWSRSKPEHVFALIETERIGKALKGTPIPALMGIQGRNDAAGALLTVITRNGPSAKAGLEPNDVVIAIDGKPVKNYDDLIKHIRANKAGNKVTVRVLRDGKPVDKKLTFGRRGGSGDRPFGTRLGGQSANVQAKQGPDGFQTGGLFHSTDSGTTWERLNSLNPRPFYYSQVHVDPVDERHVYVLGIQLYHSADGGRTFRSNAGRSVHSDHHSLWIDPADGRRVVLGCDGGLYQTRDRMATWEFVNSLPIGQFYDVGVDTRLPYRIYGGLQDNGSWGGPSALRGSVGPTSDEWFPIGGGDGFVCRVDPTDPDLVYYESQYGRMSRIHLKTGERATIRPQPPRGQPAYRFAWKTPFLLSSHNPRIFYCAGNRVFRSLDRGTNIEPISPDIARTKRGKATALAESPVDPKVLYVGTDDGALWATLDGGHKWKRLKLPGLPGPRRVNCIETSRVKAGRAWVVLDGHYHDDDAPYVFVTEDHGKNWTSITEGLPAESTRVLREDHVNPDLLYLGTEFGIWVSLDRGAHWARLNNNLPRVAVHEIALPATAGEIVAATHGRSLWLLDILPLRQSAGRALTAETHLFTPGTAVLWGGTTAKRLYGHKRYVGQNPPAGAVFQYVLRQPAKLVTLEVRDIDGVRIARMAGPTRAGLNRVTWNLRRPRNRRTPAAGGDRGRARFNSRFGSRVNPGTYRVVLDVDGKTTTSRLTVIVDPELPDTTFTLEEEDLIKRLNKTTDD